MSKQGDKVISKKRVYLCECSSEMKWVKCANNNRFYWYCDKCGKLEDRHGKLKVFGE